MTDVVLGADVGHPAVAGGPLGPKWADQHLLAPVGGLHIRDAAPDDRGAEELRAGLAPQQAAGAGGEVEGLDAAVEVEGLLGKIGATSTVVGAALLHTLVERAVEIMLARGVQPPIYSIPRTPSKVSTLGYLYSRPLG